MGLMQRSSELEPFNETQRAELALTQGPLEQARSLPPWAYADPTFHTAEERFVLRREWLSVGREAEIPKSGDYFTTTILGEPLIIVRGEDGEVRTLSAICRHRSAVVATGRGHTERFSCPYHAWIYDTTGRLHAAPMMEGNAVFNKEDCGLTPVRMETWQGWIFVNLDPDAEPLAPRLETLDKILEPYRLRELRPAGPPLVYEQHYNWKLLTDNWENYHVLGTHSDTLLPIPAYTLHTDFPWEQDDAYSIWMSPFKGEFPHSIPPLSVLPDSLNGYVGIHLFPSHLALISPCDMLYFKILHRGIDHFRLEVEILVSPEAVADCSTLLGERRKSLDFIHAQEDAPVLEGCQAGAESQLARQGYLSTEERTLWNFYKYLVPRILSGVDGQG